MSLEFLFAGHASPVYDKTVDLRYRILREPLGIGFTEEQLAAEYSDFHLYVEEDGEMKGCLILSPLSDSIVQMRQVAVETQHQGKGIGREMVYFSEKWALEKGYKKMILHAREYAVPFYLALDYHMEGDPFIEVGIPHRMMFKDLNS